MHSTCRVWVIAILLVGAVVSSSIGIARASSCAPLVGTWLLDVKRGAVAVPVFRPVTFTVHAGGTVSTVSGSNIVVLGFTARSGFLGECANIGPNLYRVMLEELLYKDGLFAGRFLVDRLKRERHLDELPGILRTGRHPFESSRIRYFAG